MKSLSDIKILQTHRYCKDDIVLQSIRLEDLNLPFQAAKEIYTLHHQQSKTDRIRGKHAHRIKEEILSVLYGNCHILLNDGKISRIYHLKDNGDCLYIPKMCWHEIIFHDNCILQVISSSTYRDSERHLDFIEDFNRFVDEKNNQ